MSIKEKLLSLKKGDYILHLRGGYELKFAEASFVKRKPDKVHFFSKQGWVVAYNVKYDDVVGVEGADGRKYI